VVLHNQKELVFCQKEVLGCQRESKVLERTILQKCLKINDLVLYNGALVDIESNGVPKIHKPILDEHHSKYHYDDEEELNDNEYKIIDEFGRVSVEKK